MKKDIFVTWWKGYKSLLRGLPPDERPKDHQEIAMFNNMIYKDREFSATGKRPLC